LDFIDFPKFLVKFYLNPSSGSRANTADREEDGQKDGQTDRWTGMTNGIRRFLRLREKSYNEGKGVAWIYMTRCGSKGGHF